MSDGSESPRRSFEFDANAFRLAAIKKSAYRFAGRCFVEIETVPNDRIRVTLRPKASHVAVETLEGEFRNEVLDQDLRETILEETEGVRNLLLAQAFSKTSLIQPEAESSRYEDDPLGIRNVEQR